MRRCVWSRNLKKWGGHDPRWVAAPQKKLWHPKDNFTVEISKGFTRIRKRPDSLDNISIQRERPKTFTERPSNRLSSRVLKNMTSESDSYFEGVRKEKLQSYTQDLRQIFLPVTSRNTCHEIWHCWISLNSVDAFQFFFLIGQTATATFLYNLRALLPASAVYTPNIYPVTSFSHRKWVVKKR